MKKTISIMIATLLAAGCGGETVSEGTNTTHYASITRTQGTGIQVFCHNDAVRDTGALTDAIGEAVNGGEIILSSNTCRIDQTINIYGKNGLSIRGQGRGSGGTGTLLEWHGQAGSPMFQICRSASGRMSNLAIMPGDGATLTSAVDVHNYCRGAAITGNDTRSWTFADVTISGRGKGQRGSVKYGVRVLPSDMTATAGVTNLDSGNGGHTFNNVTVANFVGAGFVFEGSSSRGNTLVGGGCKGGAACVSTYSEENPDLWTGGSFSWHGGNTESCRDADIVLGEVNGPVTVSGLTSMGAGMLVKHKAHANQSAKPSAYPVYIMGVRFDASYVVSTHRTVIDLHHRGPLVVTGSTLGSEGDKISEPHTAAVCFRPVDSRGAPGTAAFTFTGNAVVAPKFDPDHQKDNPFSPAGYKGCLYPTDASSNLVFQDPDREWMPMPHHPTIHRSTSQASADVHAVSTSRRVFILRNSSRLSTLTGGTVGQIIRILKHDDGMDDKPATLLDARVKGNQGNLYLRTTSKGDATDLGMYNGDTVTLMLMRTKGNKSFWNELHRSYNSTVVP